MMIVMDRRIVISYKSLEEIKGLVKNSLRSSNKSTDATAVQDLTSLRHEIERVRNEIKMNLMYLKEKDRDGEDTFLSLVVSAVQNLNNAWSKIFRTLGGTFKPQFMYAALDSNLLVLEFYMLAIFEAFRRHLNKQIITRIFDMHKSISKKIQVVIQTFQEASPDSLNIDTKKVLFSLTDLLDKNSNQFIKKKIELESGILLQDDHLNEFFNECYVLKYIKDTFLVREYVLCQYESRDKKIQPCILLIDVMCNLTAILYDPRQFDKFIDTFQYQRWSKEYIIMSHPAGNMNIGVDNQSKLLRLNLLGFDTPQSFTFRLEDVEAASLTAFLACIKTSNDSKYIL